MDLRMMDDFNSFKCQLKYGHQSTSSIGEKTPFEKLFSRALYSSTIFPISNNHSTSHIPDAITSSPDITTKFFPNSQIHVHSYPNHTLPSSCGIHPSQAIPCQHNVSYLGTYLHLYHPFFPQKIFHNFNTTFQCHVDSSVKVGAL